MSVLVVWLNLVIVLVAHICCLCLVVCLFVHLFVFVFAVRSFLAGVQFMIYFVFVA